MTEVTLRPWREGDENSIARYADNAKIAANLRDVFPHPYTLADAESFIGMCMRSAGAGELYRAIVVDGGTEASLYLNYKRAK